MEQQTKPLHPSRWSPAILEVIAPILQRWQYPVHDPFAGTGERLGQLCDALGLEFTGTEIEPEFILDPRVRAGNSKYPESYPAGPYCIVTSPVYPNGMTDHFHAQDGSRRSTYRQALAAILGEDRPLHADNMGRYGPRRGKVAEASHWDIARECVRWWPSRVILNISDCILNRARYEAVDRWETILKTADYAVDATTVATARLRHGANRDARVECEVVLVALWRQTL